MMNFRFLKPNKKIANIELQDDLRIDSACLNTDTEEIAIGVTNGQGKSELRIYESSGALRARIDSFKVYDCVWDSRTNTLLISNGNTFFSLMDGQKTMEKIVKFNHIKYAPNKCSVSPSGKYVGLLKWKSNQERFHRINLKTKELIDAKLICCSYSWIEDDTIIYSTVGGEIGYYNLNTRKKSSTPFNVKSILKSKHPSMNGLQESIKEIETKKQSWIHFDAPIKIDGSVYFVINAGKLFGSALIKFCNSEYELLFENEDKIQTYDLDDFINARMNMSRSINMKSSSYSLVEEDGEFKEPVNHFYLSKSSGMNQLIILKEVNLG